MVEAVVVVDMNLRVSKEDGREEQSREGRDPGSLGTRHTGRIVCRARMCCFTVLNAPGCTDFGGVVHCKQTISVV